MVNYDRQKRKNHNDPWLLNLTYNSGEWLEICQGYRGQENFMIASSTKIINASEIKSAMFQREKHIHKKGISVILQLRSLAGLIQQAALLQTLPIWSISVLVWSNYASDLYTLWDLTRVWYALGASANSELTVSAQELFKYSCFTYYRVTDCSVLRRWFQILMVIFLFFK